MQTFSLAYYIQSKYSSPVKRANYQLLILPEINEHQSVKDLKIDCSISEDHHIAKNLFGFNLIHYYSSNPITEFWFKLTATVTKQEVNPFPVSLLYAKEEYNLMSSLDFKIEYHRFLLETPLTKLPEHAPIVFPVYTGEIKLLDYLLELNMFIFDFLEYEPNSTDVNTPIETVLYQKKGVCQDYAHLFLSVCRKNKIPARYVSGYLNQGEDFLGTSQLHAWVEAYIPNAGWVGFDATNHLLADHHYIKIAHGCDFRDCSPMIGVLETSGNQKNIHSVKVTNQ